MIQALSQIELDSDLFVQLCRSCVTVINHSASLVLVRINGNDLIVTDYLAHGNL